MLRRYALLIALVGLLPLTARGQAAQDLALQAPDGTTVEEHAVVTDTDVIVGTQSTVGLGVRGRNVAAGERVQVDDGRFAGHTERGLGGTTDEHG